ncbi:MAG: M15 family metallopeptidase [Acidimicrobiales bacterium]
MNVLTPPTDIAVRIAAIRGRIEALSTAPRPARLAELEAPLSAGSAAPPVSFENELERLQSELFTSSLLGLGEQASALPSAAKPLGYDTFNNGQIPDHALLPIDDSNHKLHPGAAVQFLAMTSAAQKDGVTIKVSSGYRTVEHQAQLVAELGLFSHGGKAAPPGHSNHGWGLSVDLDLDEATIGWMREHAADFGFENDVGREPWHWTFQDANPA